MASELEPKPKSLWELMRQSPQVPLAEVPPAPPSAKTDEPAEAEDQESTEPSKGKGLWALMGVKAPPVPDSVPALPDEDFQEVEQPLAPPPAWFHGKAEADSSEESEPPPVLEQGDVYGEVPIPKELPAPPPQVAAEPTPFVINPLEPRQLSRPSAFVVQKKEPSRGAFLSLLVGVLALPMTLLSAMPEIWTRIPAAIVGLGALVIGLISYSEIQRSRGRQSGKGLAMTGMTLGTIAMFLGPLVVAPWSEGQTVAGSRRTTQQHLKTLGAALGEYHNQNGHFPAGGTYRVQESGERTALHSWMTQLLPHLDGQSIYQEIRREEAWSEPVNKSPMSKSVPAFLAGGVAETHSSSGYAVSHFAGIGGQVTTTDGNTANVGIFDGGAHVSRSDISDGLSQTLIAGEIPTGYRPWGEPGNWRTLEDGLNRGSTSFGNANGTGAMFLRADGSVGFISNQISGDVLKRLSTRDGEDNRLIPENYR